MADFFVPAFLSLALGGLIGLERQRRKKGPVGVRSFALTSFLGYLVTLTQNPWLIAVGFAGATAMAVLLYQAQKGKNTGITTELMVPFCFVLGVLTGMGLLLEAGVTAIVVTFLLAEKKQLHALVQTITREELIDLLLFSAITFIVFPLLPDKPFALFGLSLNLQFAWAVVVFASAISFLMHLAAKYWQPHAAELSALLGGAVSSIAALTVFSERIREKKAVAAFLALSSAGSLFSDLILLFAISPVLFEKAALPLLAIGVTFLVSYRLVGKLDSVELEPKRHPLSIPFILKFTVLFVTVSLLMGFFSQNNQNGILLTSVLAGTVSSTSAIASAAFLYLNGSLDESTASLAFLAAALSSLAAKEGLLMIRKQFGKTSLLVFALSAFSGIISWWVIHR